MMKSRVNFVSLAPVDLEYLAKQRVNYIDFNRIHLRLFFFSNFTCTWVLFDCYQLILVIGRSISIVRTQSNRFVSLLVVNMTSTVLSGSYHYLIQIPKSALKLNSNPLKGVVQWPHSRCLKISVFVFFDKSWKGKPINQMFTRNVIYNATNWSHSSSCLKCLTSLVCAVEKLLKLCFEIKR